MHRTGERQEAAVSLSKASYLTSRSISEEYNDDSPAKSSACFG